MLHFTFQLQDKRKASLSLKRGCRKYLFSLPIVSSELVGALNPEVIYLQKALILLDCLVPFIGHMCSYSSDNITPLVVVRDGVWLWSPNWAGTYCDPFPASRVLRLNLKLFNKNTFSSSIHFCLRNILNFKQIIQFEIRYILLVSLVVLI